MNLPPVVVGAECGAGLGLLLACVLVLLGRPDLSGPHGRPGVALELLVGIATIATPLLVGGALAGAHLGGPAAARPTAEGPAPGPGPTPPAAAPPR